MIEKLKQLWEAYCERRRKAKDEETRYLAKEYCKMDDRCCIPCIVVGGVPLYTVTDEPTSLTEFKVNIKDTEQVINSIRVKYAVKRKEEWRVN